MRQSPTGGNANAPQDTRAAAAVAPGDTRLLSTPAAKLIDLLPDAAVLYDRDGRIVHANASARNLYALDAMPGYQALPAAERFARLGPRDLDNHPMPYEQWHVARLLHGDVVTGVQPVIARVASLDSHRELVISYAGAPIHDIDDGTILGAISIGRDVTEQMREATERAHLADDLRLLVEQASDAILVADPQGRYVEVNGSACTLLGCTRDELLAMRMTDVVFPGDVERLAATEALLRSGGKHIGEWELRRKDGTRVPVEISSCLLSDGRCQAIARDITARKQLEREVIAQAGQISATFDALSDGLIQFDRDGRLVRMNAAAHRLLALDAPLANYTLPRNGVSRYDVRDDSGATLDRQQWPITRILLGETLAGPSAVDVVIRDMEGTERHLSVSGAPIRDEHSGIEGAVCIMRDVTKRRLFERRTRQALDALLTMAREAVMVPVPALDGASSEAGETGRKLAELARHVLGCAHVAITGLDDSQRLIPYGVAGLATSEAEQWRAMLVGVPLDRFLPSQVVDRLRTGEVLTIDAMPSPRGAASFGIAGAREAPLRLADPRAG
ncbi:MAG: PAS domain-containing protein, partial [Ktedonobacterales bacterium]